MVWLDLGWGQKRCPFQKEEDHDPTWSDFSGAGKCMYVPLVSIVLISLFGITWILAVSNLVKQIDWSFGKRQSWVACRTPCAFPLVLYTPNQPPLCFYSEQIGNSQEIWGGSQCNKTWSLKTMCTPSCLVMDWYKWEMGTAFWSSLLKPSQKRAWVVHED